MHIKEFNNMSLENKMAVITYAVEYIDLQSKVRLDMTGKTYARSQELLAKMKEADTSTKVGTTAGTGEKSPLQQMKEEIEQTKKYQAAVAQLQKSKASPEAINSMSEELAIQIAGISNEKKRIALIKDFENLLKRRRDILASTMTVEEKQLQIVDFQDKIYSRQLTLIDRRINSKQQEINKEQDLNEVRQKALDKISEQEEKINEAYDKRVEALDKVDNANQRNASRQTSRISLATALASGDIGAAAQAAAEITSQEALYKIEKPITSIIV
jgi:hypothetical protein